MSYVIYWVSKLKRGGLTFMIKVLYGGKGTGKSRTLVNTANALCKDRSGDIFFIDDSDDLIYRLDREIRFINLSEFPINEEKNLLGFICGIISENYDIDNIFVDGITRLLTGGNDALVEFLSNIKVISEKFNINFYIALHGDSKDVPEFIREYM
jgi:energy-coupling factor transporter ATP-binding protein EcfA2